MRELEKRLADSRHGIDLLGRHIGNLPLQELLLGSLLKLVTDGLSRRFAEALRPHQLSESEFLTLMQLFIHHGDGISPAELSLLVDQTRANMTHITGALVQRDFITRAASERDRRRVELRVTPAGRDFVHALLPQVFRPVRTALAGLSLPQQRSLQALLQTVIASMDAQPQPDSNGCAQLTAIALPREVPEAAADASNLPTDSQ